MSILGFGNPFHNRKTSGFAVSLGTGFALETLFTPTQPVFDEERTPAGKVDRTNYSHIYINLDTLGRNILNAMTTEESFGLLHSVPILSRILGHDPSDLASAMLEEMEIITSLCNTEGNKLISPVFYVSDYSKFYKGKAPAFSIRKPESDKQKAWFALLEKARAITVKSDKSIQSYQDSIIPTAQGSTRAIMLSHVTPDLLSDHRFQLLHLLESHTGKLKTRREWNTKYHTVGTKYDMTSLPFNKPLLTYFGDKYILRPLPISIRKQIMEISIKRRWSPITQVGTVMHDLETGIADKQVVKLLKS